MITGLVKDAYDEMGKTFIPQVVKEMSKIDAGGGKLAPYELVFKGFKGKRSGRKLRKMAKGMASDKFQYVDSDNSVPTIITLFIRYSGKTADLGDLVMDELDEINFNSKGPITAPELTDLVFVWTPKKEGEE